MSAAADAAKNAAAADATRRPRQLRAVEVGHTPLIAAPSLVPVPAEPASSDMNTQLGRSGLRLAFWLCGFHEALSERLRNGEKLTDREQALMTLSGKDFLRIRPIVIELALGRLHAVLNAAELLPKAGAAQAGAGAVGPMEAFAMSTLRALSNRAGQLLKEDGADAALGLFGDSAGVEEPLAIFQMVFTTALGLVEGFQKVTPPDSGLLGRLADALGNEVESV